MEVSEYALVVMKGDIFSQEFVPVDW